MKVEEIRGLSDNEIQSRINDSKEELMRMRFQHATGELTDHTRLQETRRTIARLYTVLRERELTRTLEGES
jgi:large subunit ribosomal protein L29